jgi:hypothetical protein
MLAAAKHEAKQEVEERPADREPVHTA